MNVEDLARVDVDVLVIGGSLVGASFVLAMRETGLKLALMEAKLPQSTPRFGSWDSRVYAISPGSAEFLRSCGIWAALDQERVTRIEEMRIFGDDTATELDFSAYDAGLGELAFTVENGELHRKAWEALRDAADVEVYAPAACTSLEISADSVEVTLDDGRCVRARLAVGADGADSWLRKQAAIGVRAQPYRQCAVVANFACSKPHQNAAYQWFRADGVLALLPLPGDRVSMVWSTDEDHAQQLLQLDAAALAARVAEPAGPLLGTLQVITPAAAFPLSLQTADHLVQPRIALIGDAAHTVHPLAGQGVNMGFRDARELAGVLKNRGPFDDCGDQYLLRRYERARRQDILALQLTTHGLQRLFAQNSKWVADARNLGLRIVNQQSFLKNLLVQQAVA
jgi:2-octaprenylphenol hydroxylase